jgi:UDP-N-acetylmuramyl pentapeptide phosphotransferase/UDP-N-acetylglucosamine-1-phosphate transferase
MPITQLAISFLISFVLVLISIPVIVTISKEKHLYDEPNERRINKVVVPNLGGIAVFIGVSIATLLSLHKFEFIEFRYIQASMIILFFIGIKDDILIISARKKLIAQILCALILIIPGGIRFTNLHGIFGLYEISYIASIAITVLAIVAIINATNLVDGIDGLAASIGIFSSVIFGSKFLVTTNADYSILCAALVGSLTAFLRFNVFGKKNKIFLGDTGSLLLGLLIAVQVIQYNEFALTTTPQETAFSPVFSLAILATPLADMIRVFAIRISKGKSPFAPDMNHVHHRLLRLGFSHISATIIIVLTNCFIIALAFAFRFLNKHLLMILLIAIIFLLLQLPDFFIRTKEKK